MLAVDLVRVNDYNVTDGSFVRAFLSAAGGILPFFSVFQYVRGLNDRLIAQRFVRSIRLHRHDFYI